MNDFLSSMRIAASGLHAQTSRMRIIAENLANVDSAGKTRAKVTATINGSSKTFDAIVRIDTPQEAEYYRSGGILPYVLRQLAGRQAAV